MIEIDENLTVINEDIFEHLAPEKMCRAWLYEEMARADTLICGSQTVVANMFDVLETETERRLNDDFNAPRMAKMLRVPTFSWPVKPKPSRRSYNVRRLLVADFVTGQLDEERIVSSSRRLFARGLAQKFLPHCRFRII